MICYRFLDEALSHYRVRGYHHIEVPWLVSEEADDCTKPPDSPFGPLDVQGLLRLPASGEQGFIHLMQRGELPPARYVTLTPCFRQERQYDALRRPWFMKVELIDVGVNTTMDLLRDAESFFSPFLEVKTVQTEGGYDLESLDGIELGSYGFRERPFGCWTYGTGLAEPRFSEVLKRDGPGVKAFGWNS